MDANTALTTLVGPHAQWRDGQEEAIDALVTKHERVICVQRTGWGKSAVYFIAASMLRSRGDGPTFVVSPLLALMRNQLAAAQRLGLNAYTINSSNVDDWDTVVNALRNNTVDLLLISPERLNNPKFRQEVLPTIMEHIALLVIDEAHCISDWGHDFRPDYRRINDLVASLSPATPVLCTTATANERVIADIQQQIAAENEQPTILRGGLERESLHLHVAPCANDADRLAWLAQWIPQLQGSGIVYCLTIAQTELVHQWFQQCGISSRVYTGQVDNDERIATETALADNEVTAVIATSALGMGYDKADLAWVVHYGSPGSIISYYQQVGRAGRGIDTATAVLLPAPEDIAIQNFFIHAAFPARAVTEHVLELITQQPMSVPSLMQQVNLGKTSLENMLKILDVDGIVAYEDGLWHRTETQWQYPQDHYAHITSQRKSEQAAMVDYTQLSNTCLMRFLCQYLHDPLIDEAYQCGRCDACLNAKQYEIGVYDEYYSDAVRLLRTQHVTLPVKKQWPATQTRTRKKIDESHRLHSLNALSASGDGGWNTLCRAYLEGNNSVEEELIDGINHRLIDLDIYPESICVVPSSHDRMIILAKAVATSLELPFDTCLSYTRNHQPQSEFRNASSQYNNLINLFSATGVRPLKYLLLDDTTRSGWTMTVAGALLLHHGARRIDGFALVKEQ